MANMKFHFSLYGFLKNQKFYEPFILIFFKNKGLTLTEIGFLFAFRELIANLTEIPSGAVADLWGKKKVMILSFASYIMSFSIFSFSSRIWLLILGFIFFGIGEAFRTGTHKAIIYEYLKSTGQEGRLKTFYGYTRSWSKIGSAVSIIFALLIVFFSNSYQYIFLFAALPYILGIKNFLFYPDEKKGETFSFKKIAIIWEHLKKNFIALFAQKKLAILFTSGWIYNGFFKILKDYLQLIVKSSLIAFPFFLTLTATKRESLLIGSFYFIFHLVSAYGSRSAERFSQQGITLSFLILLTATTIGITGISLQLKYFYLSIFLFILYGFIQNIFRPLFLAEAVNLFPEKDGIATFLSIENQGQTLVKILIAPLLGWLADHSLSYPFYFSAFTLFAIFILLKNTEKKCTSVK